LAGWFRRKKEIKMKTMRTFSVAVLVAGFFFGSNFISHAQTQVQAAQSVIANAPALAAADSVVSIIAETHGLQLVPPDQWNRFGTYWYVLQGKFLVPCPGPPNNPNLRIYSLGDELSFLVDENTPPVSGVNYARLETDLNWVLGALAQAEEAKANAQLNAELNVMLGVTDEMSPMDGGGAGPNGPGGFDPDVLHVESLTLSNGFLIFDIQGLIPGNTFLLARKKVLDDNFRNYWAPQWSFTATASNQIVSIPFP
jgi:hypothetical protein